MSRMSSYVAGFWVLLASLFVVAARRHLHGSWKAFGQPELGVASLFVAAALLTVALRPVWATRFVDLDVAMLVVDLALLGGLTGFGLVAGRGWILCAAALQLISATAHLVRLTTPGMWRLGYQVMEEASSYPTLLLLAWGLWAHRRKTRTMPPSTTSSPDRGAWTDDRTRRSASSASSAPSLRSSRDRMRD